MRRMPSAPPNSPGLEHHVVTRRRLAGLGRIRRGPVVLGEHERGEIDLLGEFDEPVERVPPWVERGHPGLNVGDVPERACDRLEQFCLFSRRSEEDTRLVHVRLMMTDIAHTLRRGPHVGILHALSRLSIRPAYRFSRRSVVKVGLRYHRRSWAHDSWTTSSGSPAARPPATCSPATASYASCGLA